MISVPGYISPIALSLGMIQIHWYGIAYAVSFVFVHILVSRHIRLGRIYSVNKKQWDDLIQWLMLGVLLGGRLGYVLFYQPSWWSDPLRVLRIWEGGMSFHGACLGVVAVIYIFSKRHRIDWIVLFDHVLPWVPVGLFLGRLANFINGELPGRITQQAWAVIFNRIDFMPRHPSPLYEACGEGVLLGLLLVWAKTIRCRGWVSAMFLIGYGVIRGGLECFREPDPQVGFIAKYITLGQCLSMVMVIMGMVVYVFVCAQQTNRKHEQKSCQ